MTDNHMLYALIALYWMGVLSHGFLFWGIQQEKDRDGESWAVWALAFLWPLVLPAAAFVLKRQNRKNRHETR